MTNTKSVFLRADPSEREPLWKWWATIVNDTRFDSVLIFARSEMAESRPTQEQLIGAEVMLDTLKNLAVGEQEIWGYPTPGLVHQMPEKQSTTQQG